MLADGYDPVTVLGAVLEYLAESWATEERSLCPNCGKRRIARTASMCSYCIENWENQLLWKRRWWAAHGQENRLAHRAAAQATQQNSGVVSIPAVEVEW